MLGRGPNSLILALEEGVKAVLRVFKARYGDTRLCARSDPHASNAERGTSQRSIDGANLVSSALENKLLPGCRDTNCSVVNGELIPS